MGWDEERGLDSWAPTETDCSNLQSWFDGAYNMHGSVSGDLEAMQWYTALMVGLTVAWRLLVVTDRRAFASPLPAFSRPE